MFSGGGARAAYQVGLLRVLAREFPGCRPGILTGVSAGGINAAYLAARQEPFAEKVEDLADVWTQPSHRRCLPRRSARSASRTRAVGRAAAVRAASRRCRRRESLVDTAPLRETLERVLEADGGVLAGIARSLQAGWLRVDRADRVELHDRAVDHVGADARRLRHRRRGSGRSARARAARCASTT